MKPMLAISPIQVIIHKKAQTILQVALHVFNKKPCDILKEPLQCPSQLSSRATWPRRVNFSPGYAITINHLSHPVGTYQESNRKAGHFALTSAVILAMRSGGTFPQRTFLLKLGFFISLRFEIRLRTRFLYFMSVFLNSRKMREIQSRICLEFHDSQQKTQTRTVHIDMPQPRDPERIYSSIWAPSSSQSDPMVMWSSNE